MLQEDWTPIMYDTWDAFSWWTWTYFIILNFVRVAVCVAVYCGVLRYVRVFLDLVGSERLQYIAVCCSVVQCGAVWCSVVPCVTVCESLSQLGGLSVF